MKHIQVSHQFTLFSDDPKMVSSRHKDFYEDILEARRKESDILFSLRTRETPVYKYNEKRNNDAIKQEVMNSDRVKYAVEQVHGMLCFIFCQFISSTYFTSKVPSCFSQRLSYLKCTQTISIEHSGNKSHSMSMLTGCQGAWCRRVGC